MRINGRWVPLAAPEGDNGGGGAPPPPEAPAPEAAPAAPAQPDYAAIIAQQQQALQQMQAQQAELLQRFQPQQRQEEHPPEEEYLDPAVKKHLEALRRQQEMSNLQLQDQMDQRHFFDEVNRTGVEAELAQKAQQLHRYWMDNGMRIGTQPPSRIDALNYVAGAQSRQSKVSARTAAQQAEALRIAQNQDAQLGVGSRAVRGAPTVNLDTMDRKQRLETGYPAILDTEGF